MVLLKLLAVISVSPASPCSQQAFPSPGLFLRHMILAYNKLSFSQVYKLYTALQQYFQKDEKKDGADENDMELTNPEELDGKMEKEELDGPLR